MISKKEKVLLSLVIPVFNEELVVSKMASALEKLAKKLPKKTEVIWVDDGSQDRTVAEIKRVSLPFSQKIISLSRNFGHQASLCIGLEQAKGKFVITLDGDLQHPPNLIPEMLKLHAQGYDIVLTKRIDSFDISLTKKLFSHFFYKLINMMSETEITENGSDFRSLNRNALDALLSLPEHRKFLRGMVTWLGFRTIILPFQANERALGKSKYTWIKMWRLALNGITSFSAFPLQLASVFSLVLFTFAFLYALYVLYVKLIIGDVVSGWASVTFVLLLVGGFLSLFIGLVGVYLAAIYEEIKARPIAVIRDTFTKKAKKSTL